ncbi:elongation of very long chain fatty acids protein 4-like isoform X1 [Patiria miniata]|uniref:Elongation of very long chain fatty acids protein n=1 Tax=Patiria miniata TaxID=46514 RepID=A0A913ZAI0_PATMI|nr:elongation of very long chain fatty acids protein 4-like isoform X1 [Patiria miniata]XP_038048773.1 elongation of very long chain fatty acids protein 4-like isoform X1 [Patiria miniata]XP_038048774.1 elongation of very long chain fatty acids protein 4-like isoform X1 [Patiria miniata]
MDFISGLGAKVAYVYELLEAQGDPRVENWLLMKSPIPISCIVIGYLLVVWLGPKLMANRNALQLKPILVLYNFFLVGLSIYMFYEFRVTSWKANYSYRCQPVDYSNSVLGMRMARVCWWYFFSKVIEVMDTIFFILRKKNNQLTFLHVYHHSSMMVNWYLGVKLIAGGQSFFLAMLNSFVHIIMYSYYGLAALGPGMQKYLWWKRYMTQIQLMQFLAVIIHTGYNIWVDCDFPQGFNYAVFLYSISLVALFGNFYLKAYTTKQEKYRV